MILLLNLLRGPCSQWPGIRGLEDDIDEFKNREKEFKKLQRHDSEMLVTDNLRNSMQRSPLGEAIKSSDVSRCKVAAAVTASELSQIAYGGSYKNCMKIASTYLRFCDLCPVFDSKLHFLYH